jgi:hypothetical protein
MFFYVKNLDTFQVLRLFFSQNFQAQRLFPALRLFQTLE